MTDLPGALIRVELDGFVPVGAGARTTNVYVAPGPRPALIGAGHPANTPQLLAALEALGFRASDIDRVIVNSWSPEVLGGCAAFVRADIFVTSPDLVAPRQWNSWNAGRRAEFLQVADDVFDRVDAWSRADLEPWLGRAFPSLTNNLEFVPLRTGHTVAAGELELEVVAAPGVHAGHSHLWCAELAACFCGEVEFDGLPTYTESARNYIISLERAMQLEPTWLLPAHGAATDRAMWTLKRLARFCTNYLSNAPATLLKGRTLLEIVDGDLGYLPEHPAPYIESVRQHRSFMEELVSSNVIRGEGEGLDRRYIAA